MDDRQNFCYTLVKFPKGMKGDQSDRWRKTMGDWRTWKPYRWHLSDGQVHVWRLKIDRSSAGEERRGFFLDASERHRAGKFVRGEDRTRFMVGRGMLRRILSLHLCCAPADLAFAEDRFGRPRLVAPSGSGLDFNISHSGHCILVALASGRRVGVDVEEILHGIETTSIMRDLFTNAEQASVAVLSGEAREKAFYWYWTRKEALAKAIGTGLSAPLATLDVGSETLRNWEVRTLSVGRGYRAAVAASGHGWNLSCFDV